MDISAINNIHDFKYFLTGVKTKQLKEICKQHRIKLSFEGRTNKRILLENIYEYIFGMLPGEHTIHIIHMTH